MDAFKKFVKNNTATLLFLVSAPALVASTANAKSALCMGFVVCAIHPMVLFTL